MQCPACNHEASQAEFGDPLKCPSCGAFYSKALAAKQRAAAAAEQPNGAASPPSGINVRAKPSVQARQAFQPVVVVDVQMRFWSMVVFMVKWVFASIPAFLIIAVLFTVIWGVGLGVLVGGVGKVTPPASPPVPAPSSISAPASIELLPKRAEERVPTLTISATIWDKSFMPRDLGHDADQLAFGLSFRNHTGQVVNAFDGTAFFKDVLGNEVFRADVIVDAYLPVSEPINRGFTVRYNRFIESHVKFKDMAMDRLHVEFKPKKILFKSGEVQTF